jgi:hypothetical protein
MVSPPMDPLTRVTFTRDGRAHLKQSISLRVVLSWIRGRLVFLDFLFSFFFFFFSFLFIISFFRQ